MKAIKTKSNFVVKFYNKVKNVKYLWLNMLISTDNTLQNVGSVIVLNNLNGKNIMVSTTK